MLYFALPEWYYLIKGWCVRIHNYCNEDVQTPVIAQAEKKNVEEENKEQLVKGIEEDCKKANEDEENCEKLANKEEEKKITEVAAPQVVNMAQVHEQQLKDIENQNLQKKERKKERKGSKKFGDF